MDCLIGNVKIIDGTGRAPFAGAVRVEGSRILEVIEGAASPPGREAGGRVIDGHGATLMPGLIESHAHLGLADMSSYDLTRLPPEEQMLITVRNARTMLDCGYTSAFSAAAAKPRLDTVLKREIEAGREVGPRFLANGPELTVTGGLGDTNLMHLPHYETPTFAWVVDGPDEIRRVCRTLARDGVDLLKLNLSGDIGTSSFKSEATPMTDGEVAAAMEVARAGALRVAAHCRSAESVMMALRHGIEVIYHANWADERALDALEAARDRVFVGPALGITYNLSQAGGQGGVPTERARAFERELEVTVEVVARMRKRGIRVLPGGDYGFPVTPHGTYARDLWLFVKILGFSAHGDPGRRDAARRRAHGPAGGAGRGEAGGARRSAAGRRRPPRRHRGTPGPPRAAHDHEGRGAPQGARLTAPRAEQRSQGDRSMPRLSRRDLLRTGAGAATGMASWLALGRAPARAQKRQLSVLSFNSFVPASDEELRRQAEAFGRQAGAEVRVDTISSLQLPAKLAAEAQSQAGHDIVRTSSADPFLYEGLLVDVGDVVERVGKEHGGWYGFAAESCQTASGWRSVPWHWNSFPANYNMAHFRKAGLEPPRTWAELLKHGKALKAQGHPVGIAISHSNDANTTFTSVLWSYGGRVFEADGKTPGISSDRTAQVIEWYKEIYRDAMEPEVLSWDDSSNNRFLLAGKGSWIHNPISAYVAAATNKQPIAEDIGFHNSLAGPGGTHSAPSILSLGIWKFSKQADLAKEFIQYLFRKENYDAWIVASSAFNHPPLKALAEHPIWTRNPKFAMLPKEAEYGHARSWPARPSAVSRLVDVTFVMPDMVAKAIQGMPTARAMAWAEDQVKLALAGKLEPKAK